jgi:hypothetical protein
LQEESKHPQNSFAGDEDIGFIEDDCVLNVEQLPFNVLENEYDNFELRDKIFEKTASVML